MSSEQNNDNSNDNNVENMSGEDQREEAQDTSSETTGETRGDGDPVPDAGEAVEGEAVPGEPEAEDVVVEGPETADADQVAALTAELERVRAERDEHLESMKRMKAEFENSRKRQERERERAQAAASEGIVKDLLPVMDNLDRALEAEGDIRGGVHSTRDQLAGILGEAGLSLVSSDGEHFDPNVHEAVMGQPSDEHEDGTVIQTFERGYVLNGKPIRPAKVVVARQG